MRVRIVRLDHFEQRLVHCSKRTRMFKVYKLTRCLVSLSSILLVLHPASCGWKLVSLVRVRAQMNAVEYVPMVIYVTETRS